MSEDSTIQFLGDVSIFVESGLTIVKGVVRIEDLPIPVPGEVWGRGFVDEHGCVGFIERYEYAYDSILGRGDLIRTSYSFFVR